MKDLVSFGLLLFTIHSHLECCTIVPVKCHHMCVKVCYHGDGARDCLGDDCSGFVGHFLHCPQGAFSLQFGRNSSRSHCFMLGLRTYEYVNQ